ncbi:lipopolysaccharide biosynthesis protein [uncultured Cellulomonas sp.]|uniref:lipopolysaccharide biosynthesis protein n=1 Tax=uncultured Cellulomonas sp. TaxID=189682 RepID=UPI002631EE06|nr:oligosaccharide flippase family protein [uncultured Cellulomonas sp.]
MRSVRGRSPAARRGDRNGGGPDQPSVGAGSRRRRRAPLSARSSRLARDSVWSFASEGFQLVATLAVFYLLTTHLGPAQYGYFSGSQALVAILATLSHSWIALLLLQEIVREGRPEPHVFGMGLGLLGVTGVLAVGAAAALSPLLLPGIGVLVVVLFAVAELFGLGVVFVSAALLQATVSYAESARVRIAFLAVRLSAVVGLAVTDRLSLLSVAVAYCAVSVTCGLGSLAYVSARRGFVPRPRRPDASELRSGLGYAGTLASFALQEDSDKILLVRLADPVTAGLYAAAYRGVQIAVVPIRAILASSHSRFLEHDPRARGQHLRRSLRFTGLATAYAVVAVGVLVVGAPLIPLVLGDAYRQTAAMLPWLAGLVLLRALSLFGFNGLMGLRRNGARLGIIVCSALAAVVGGVVLITGYSWRGAVLATVVAELVFIGLTWLALVRYQRVHDRTVPEGAPA